MTKRLLLLICLLAPLAYAGYRWHEHSQAVRRQRALASGTARIEQALATNIALYDLAEQPIPLDRLLQAIERRSQIAIRCDLAELAAEKIAPDAPVQLPAAELRLGAALRHALEQHGLAAINRGDHLWITTRDAADDVLCARLYRLPAVPTGTAVAAEDEQQWIGLIRLAEPNSWAEVGGLGHVEFLPGALLVVNTDDVHRRIADLLRQFEHPFRPLGGSFYDNLGTPDDLRIHKGLRRPASVFFNQMPLCDALRHLQTEHDLPIVLREWKLAEAGINPDIPVTKTLRNISLGAVLFQMLDELELTYTVCDGVVQVTTPEDAEQRLLTVVYDVGELVDRQTGTRDIDTLSDMIMSAVAPESWDEVGGAGSMIALGDRWLAFSQTEAVHVSVAELLTGLRQHLLPSTGKNNSSRPEHQSLAERHAQAALERKIALDLGAIPLCDLCEYLSDALDVNVVCHQRRLDEIAVPLDLPIHCQLPRMELRRGLELLLEPLSLAVVVRDESLLVTNEEDAAKTLETQIYDVGSFDPEPMPRDPFNPRPDPLIEVLVKTLNSHSWDRYGGPGSINRFGGLLVVSQTPNKQRQVRKLLNSLREMSTGDLQSSDVGVLGPEADRR